MSYEATLPFVIRCCLSLEASEAEPLNGSAIFYSSLKGGVGGVDSITFTASSRVIFRNG